METENRLIAEFMGYEFIDGEFRIPHSDKTRNSDFSEWCSTYGDIDGMFSVGYLLAPSNLMFHSDWNWLMEVVEKIFKDFYKLNPCPIGLKIVIEKQLIKVNKEAVYNTCVEFIKWYNEQK